MNEEITESVVPEGQRVQYEMMLRCVRMLSSGMWTRDPSAPVIHNHAEPTPAVHPVDANESKDGQYECRSCRWRYNSVPMSCVMCGCQYFDRV